VSSGDTFFGLLKQRLLPHFVTGWSGRDGEELFRAVARVWETLSARQVDELRAARILVATGPEKATGSVTLALAVRTGPTATVLAGQPLFKTAWGVEYVLAENLVWPALVLTPTTVVVDVEARWAGWEGNVDANLVSEWSIADVNNVESLTWSGLTTEEGQEAFLAAIVSGGVSIVASSQMAGGRMGTLDLLALGAGKPRALDEVNATLRARLRTRVRAVSPGGVRDAVRSMLQTQDVVIAEPWDWGFAIGVSGIGEHAIMPGTRYAVVLVPEGTDTNAVQEFVNRIRPWGHVVLVLEADASVFA